EPEPPAQGLTLGSEVMLGEEKQNAQRMSSPLRNDQPSGGRPADDFDTPLLHLVGQVAAQSSHMLGMWEDGILVDPAAAVVPGDVDEVVILDDGMRLGQDTQRFLRVRTWPLCVSHVPNALLLGPRQKSLQGMEIRRMFVRKGQRRAPARFQAVSGD